MHFLASHIMGHGGITASHVNLENAVTSDLTVIQVSVSYLFISKLTATSDTTIVSCHVAPPTGGHSSGKNLIGLPEM